MVNLVGYFMDVGEYGNKSFFHSADPPLVSAFGQNQTVGRTLYLHAAVFHHFGVAADTFSDGNPPFPDAWQFHDTIFSGLVQGKPRRLWRLLKKERCLDRVLFLE